MEGNCYKEGTGASRLAARTRPREAFAARSALAVLSVSL